MQSARPVTDNLRPRVAELLQNAFRFPKKTAVDESNAPAEQLLVIPEGDRVASSCRVHAFRCYADGKLLPSGGIGNVSTWADLQGKGHASQLMRDAVACMHERGDALSQLYPFSARYYRKLGWELCGRKYIYGPFHQRDVKPADEAASVRPLLNLEDWEILDKAYRRFAPRYFGTLDRMPDRWKGRLEGILNDRGQMYIIEDDHGPAGYMVCTFKTEEGRGNHCRVVEFGFADDRAVRGLIAFLGRLPVNVCDITIEASPSPDLIPYFLEPYIGLQIQSGFMLRIVEMKRAVEMRGAPAGVSGEVVVGITDEVAPWNAGNWRLVFDQQNASAEKVSTAPDVAFTVQQFARLYGGAFDPVAAAAFGSLPADDIGALGLLRAAYGQVPFCPDGF